LWLRQRQRYITSKTKRTAHGNYYVLIRSVRGCMDKTKTYRLHKDDRGSVMILVLVCMFMISLIGAMLLSTTVINYKMKLNQKQASVNFYDAEAVLEETTVSARQTLMSAYQESYERLLLNYLDPSVVADRQAYFIKDIATELELNPQAKPELGEDVYVAKNIGKFSEILNRINAQLGGRGRLEFAPDEMVVIDVRQQSFSIKDVKLLFTDDSGFQTQIRTDLVMSVTMPDDSFASSGTQINRYVDNYVVITNSDIIADSSGTGGAGGTISKVRGSLYAGHNLEVKAGLDIVGERVILGESLLLPDGSRLTAATGHMENNGVWARNIQLSGGKLNLAGDCYVVDDTTFSAENGELTIQGGGYYGYSYSEQTEGDPGMSSAILINKPNNKLDLSGADMLWLAGNAYIRETKLFDDLDSNVGAADGVMEGESIAYKNLQSAYLLPGCCIVGVGHNPIVMTQTFSKKKGETLTHAYLISEPGKVTVDEMTAVEEMRINGSVYAKDAVVPAGTLLPINTILPAGTVLPCDISTPVVDMVLNTDPVNGSYFTDDGYYIDLPVSRTEVGIDLSQYADAIKPVIVRYSNTKQMAYYYIRFLSTQKAADYFQEFSRTETGARLLKQLETLKEAQILLPAASENIVTVGNLTEYEYNPYSQGKEYGVHGANSADNLLWRESLLTSSYNAFLTKLTPGGRLDSSAVPVRSDELNIFHYLINPTYFAQEDEDNQVSGTGNKLVIKEYEDETGNKIQLCIAMGVDVETNTIKTKLGELNNAVVIADGNVVVDTAFAGVIIAKGNVTLKISGDTEVLSEGKTGMANLIRHKDIGPYFQAYKPLEEEQEDTNRLQMTELIQIRFEDWVKN